jgi:hypothetical protein
MKVWENNLKYEIKWDTSKISCHNMHFCISFFSFPDALTISEMWQGFT